MCVSTLHNGINEETHKLIYFLVYISSIVPITYPVSVMEFEC